MGVPILIDEETAKSVSLDLDAEEGYCRRVACLRPAGVDEPLNAYALISARDKDLTLTGEQLRAHDEAVEAVISKSWEEAKVLLDLLPLTDGPANFLRAALSNLGEAPNDWDGAINMEDKSGHRMMTYKKK
jgi:hypothetical protein